MVVVLCPYFQWDLTFKAALQFTSKPIITLANLLSKTSAEHPRDSSNRLALSPQKQHWGTK